MNYDPDSCCMSHRSKRLPPRTFGRLSIERFGYASFQVDKIAVHLLQRRSLREQALDRLVCQITRQTLVAQCRNGVGVVVKRLFDAIE